MNDNEGPLPQQIAHLESMASTLRENLKEARAGLVAKPDDGKASEAGGRARRAARRSGDQGGEAEKARPRGVIAASRHELRDRYVSTFSKLEVPQAAAAKATIGKIASLSALGRERFGRDYNGPIGPTDRMTASRM